MIKKQGRRRYEAKNGHYAYLQARNRGDQDMNGVSKKLCATAGGLAAIVSMGDDPDRLPFAIIVGIICVVNTLVQGYLDLKKQDAN